MGSSFIVLLLSVRFFNALDADNQTQTYGTQDFMIQGGDPTGTGRGGTSIYGQKLYVSILFRSVPQSLSMHPVRMKSIPS